MAGDIEYEVLPNDCLSKIAKQHGFTWKKLWDYGPNAGLKQKRKDPNILMPGDIVVIPALAQKDESKSVNQLHRFKRKKEQAILHIRLLLAGKPLDEEDCTLVIHAAGVELTKSGKTDGDGNVQIEGTKEIKLPGDTRSAYLRVGSPPHEMTYPLSIGDLAPFDQVLGVQQRLNNLGYAAGKEDGIMGPRTESAVREFQLANSLAIDGIPGPLTQNKLKLEHGC